MIDIVFAIVDYGDGDLLVTSNKQIWETEKRQSDGGEEGTTEQIETDLIRAGLDAGELSESVYDFMEDTATVETAIKTHLPHWHQDPAFTTFMGG